MIAAHEWLAAEAVSWWPRVADHLWQSTLFALIVLAASFVLRRGPARVRHSLWALASAKFLVPTALFVFLAEQVADASSWLFNTTPPSGQSALLQGFTEPVWLIVNNYEFFVLTSDTARHSEIYCVLTSFWLVGCLMVSAVWAMGRRRFLLALNQGRSVQDGREWEALKSAQGSLGMKSEVELIISSRETEPAVCRVWKPAIMLPESVAEHLDDVELQAIMLHELVHIQRRDNLIGNLQMALCALLWFHPLVWFINRKLYDEREQSCDEKVLEVCAEPEVYAASILKVVRFSFGWKMAGVIGAASGTNLRRRIDNIMSTDKRKRNAWGRRLLAGTLLSLTLVLMVAGGLYNRVDSASFDVAVGSSEGYDTQENADRVDVRVRAQRKRKRQPPLPPQPPQPPQEPQLSQPAQPTQPTQPSPPGEPANPTQATQPTQVNRAKQPRQPPPPASMSSPSVPSSPPPPPSRPDDYDKSSSKAKREFPAPQDKGEIIKGELIDAPPPVYPDEAREQKIEGTVTVRIVIDEEGKVISANVATGHQLLHGASRDAALKARFKPTTVKGKPAKVSGAMTYNFVLDKK